MFWYLIPIIIFILSLGGIAVIIFRHQRTLLSLDLEAMKIHQQKEVKLKLLEKRLLRRYAELKNKLRIKFQPIAQKIKNRISQLFQKIKTKKPVEVPEEILRQRLSIILGEAKVLSEADKLGEAEKKYIEAVALDKTNLEAYQGLSRVYLSLKDYSHALETLNFLRKINPLDETVWLDLCNVYRQMDNKEEAVVCCKKAAELNPNNPKNLDALLEIAILAKEKYLAMRTFDKLKEVNFDNQKLIEYEKQIKEL